MRACNLLMLGLFCLGGLQACDPIQTGLIEVQVRTRDAKGAAQPVVGAQCTLEPDMTLETDGQGRVRFAGASAGPHAVRCLHEAAEVTLAGVVEVEVPLEVGHPGWVEASLELVPLDAPLRLEVELLPEGARVRWSPPVNSGGVPLLGYRLWIQPEGPALELEPTTHEVLLAELEAGEVYAVEVATRTLFGVGPAAVSKDFLFATVPSSPLDVDALAELDAALVFWSPPESDGGTPITAFHIVATPGALRRTADAGAKLLRFEGLEPGVSYAFRVIAENAIGEGPPSVPSPEIILP